MGFKLKTIICFLKKQTNKLSLKSVVYQKYIGIPILYMALIY